MAHRLLNLAQRGEKRPQWAVVGVPVHTQPRGGFQAGDHTGHVADDKATGRQTGIIRQKGKAPENLRKRCLEPGCHRGWIYIRGNRCIHCRTERQLFGILGVLLQPAPQEGPDVIGQRRNRVAGHQCVNCRRDSIIKGADQVGVARQEMLDLLQDVLRTLGILRFFRLVEVGHQRL